MSKQIIIDWQRDGLFVAMGSRRGTAVSIDTLVTTGGQGTTGSSTAISTQLFALAKQLDLAKSEATVIAPREVLEFRALTIPRGDADEVPDMVRFQAQRQMANIGDTWPLDYVLLPDQPGSEGISALAATISPAHMAEIEATCSDLGITLVKVLARPVEIARWGVSVGGLANAEAAMVIAVSQTHADLLAVSYGSLIQVRAARLPEDPASLATALVSEIRRGLMAASSFLNNQPISKVVLIAAPDIAERVESQIAEATAASVMVVDPASVLPAKLPERHELGQRAASRIAALAGVVSNNSSDNRNVIDLKNIKKRQPKKGRTREYVIAAAAAALLLMGGTFWYWSTHANLDMMIAAQNQVEKDKAKEVKERAIQVKQRDDVDRFLTSSINWLDELNHISAHAPESRDIMLSNPTFELKEDRNGASGKITFTAEARDSGMFSKLQDEMSDSGHQAIGGGPTQLQNKKGDYAWAEREEIRIGAVGWDPLAKPAKAPNAKPADKAASKPADKSAGKVADKPADEAVDQAADKEADKEADKPIVKPDDKAAEQPAGKSADKPTADPVATPTTTPATPPAVTPAVTPTASAPSAFPTVPPVAGAQ